MPRKTLRGARRRGRRRLRFNEAAARCRGKPRAVRETSVYLPPIASMRPRPDAAENRGVEVQRVRAIRASMRPRPDAAENPLSADTPRTAQWTRFNEAAARCRGKPGRNRLRRRARRSASMRPRPDAAENRPSRPSRIRWCSRFNEAAARCRGKPCRWCAHERRPYVRFNEAAARCRGKPLTDKLGSNPEPKPLQ